jgi:hypothetical protein
VAPYGEQPATGLHARWHDADRNDLAPDFNKDGWNNTNGTNLAWTMNGVTRLANVSLPGSVSGWHMVGPR